MARTPTEIDFTPTENLAAITDQLARWLQADPAPVNPNTVKDIEEFRATGELRNLYLKLGGYVTSPVDPTRQESVEATVDIDVYTRNAETYTDPQGDLWEAYTVQARPNWPSYGGSQGAKLGRLRADMVDEAVSLAERFDERFKDTMVWVRLMTKAEQEAQARRWQEDATRIKLAQAIKEAIHTTCRGMRVAHERWIEAPEGSLVGRYDIILEHKEYVATVMPDTSRRAGEVLFRRTR